MKDCQRWGVAAVQAWCAARDGAARGGGARFGTYFSPPSTRWSSTRRLHRTNANLRRRLSACEAAASMAPFRCLPARCLLRRGPRMRPAGIERMHLIKLWSGVRTPSASIAQGREFEPPWERLAFGPACEIRAAGPAHLSNASQSLAWLAGAGSPWSPRANAQQPSAHDRPKHHRAQADAKQSCQSCRASAWMLGDMTPVGLEPTPFRTGALSQRLRPLGQSVLGASSGIRARTCAHAWLHVRSRAPTRASTACRSWAGLLKSEAHHPRAARRIEFRVAPRRPHSILPRPPSSAPPNEAGSAS